MKPRYFFRFSDDRPEIRTLESRQWVARAIKAYRKNPSLYVVCRLPLGFLVATRDYSAVATFTRE